MIRVRCPICAKSFEIAKLDDLPSFPFCSDRCRMIDLGRWIDGSYTVPAEDSPPPQNPSDDEGSAEEED